jgi:hypothetical protein
MHHPLRKQIRNESHLLDFVRKYRGQLALRPLVRDEPRLYAALAQKPEVVPGQNCFATEAGGRIGRDDYNFHLADSSFQR